VPDPHRTVARGRLYSLSLTNLSFSSASPPTPYIAGRAMTEVTADMTAPTGLGVIPELSSISLPPFVSDIPSSATSNDTDTDTDASTNATPVRSGTPTGTILVRGRDAVGLSSLGPYGINLSCSASSCASYADNSSRCPPIFKLTQRRRMTATWIWTKTVTRMRPPLLLNERAVKIVSDAPPVALLDANVHVRRTSSHNHHHHRDANSSRAVRYNQ
jgi:hypothetical protein